MLHTQRALVQIPAGGPLLHGTPTPSPTSNLSTWTDLQVTWLLDSTWSLHVFLRFQSVEFWQNLQNKTSHRNLLGSVLRGQCRLPRCFRRWTQSREPCLHCFEGGAQCVEGACCATQFCFPPCSFPQTFVPLPQFSF